MSKKIQLNFVTVLCIYLSIYLSTCELFARVEEVGYPGVVSLLLLEQPFLGNLLVALKPMI